MREILTIAITELRLLRRERLFVAVAAVFMVIAAAASLIGWSTSNTVNRAYSLSVPLMQPGAPIPPNPFANVSHLSLERNLGIYFFLIGSLMAIIIGYSAAMRDRAQGMTALVLTRSQSRLQFATGKLTALVFTLGVILTATWIVVMTLTFVLPALSLSSAQIVKLSVFFAISWLYLTIFGCLGLISGFLARSHTQALLIPVTAWIIIGFVVPQLISGAEPTALLNPVTVAAPDHSQGFFAVTRTLFAPLSFAEQYKHLSVWLLEFEASPIGIMPVLSLTGAFAGAIGLYYAALRRWQPTASAIQ